MGAGHMLIDQQLVLSPCDCREPVALENVFLETSLSKHLQFPSQNRQNLNERIGPPTSTMGRVRAQLPTKRALTCRAASYITCKEIQDWQRSCYQQQDNVQVPHPSKRAASRSTSMDLLGGRYRYSESREARSNASTLNFGSKHVDLLVEDTMTRSIESSLAWCVL